MSQVKPGAIRAALPKTAPEAAEPFEAIFADLDALILPGLSHFNHPGFFGYFPANSELVVGARRLSLHRPRRARPLLAGGAGADRAGGGRRPTGCASSSACPRASSGVIQDTASTSTLVALISAREQAERFLPRARRAGGARRAARRLWLRACQQLRRQGGAAGGLRARQSAPCRDRRGLRDPPGGAGGGDPRRSRRRPQARRHRRQRRHDRRHRDRSGRRARRRSPRRTGCGCMSTPRWRARR